MLAENERAEIKLCWLKLRWMQIKPQWKNDQKATKNEWTESILKFNHELAGLGWKD